MRNKKILTAIAAVVMSFTCLFASACFDIINDVDGGTSNVNSSNNSGSSDTSCGTTPDTTTPDTTTPDVSAPSTTPETSTPSTTPNTPTPDTSTGSGGVTSPEDTKDKVDGGDISGGEDEDDGGSSSNGKVSQNSKFTYLHGGSECVAVEWTESSASSATVSYKLSSDSSTSAYQKIDTQLVRQISSSTARADILGLAAGTYDIKVVSGSTTFYAYSVNVSAYDRSGYAHFGYDSGVGAYNDDGTLKSNAQVIYVSEETKNTVTAKINNKSYTGIVNILMNAKSNSVPIDVRVIGRISAATWNNIDYSDYAVYNPESKKYEVSADKITGANGNSLLEYAESYVDNSNISSSKKCILQSDLIKDGFNTLNIDSTNGITELNGLYSYITYASGEFDSFWNNCVINSVENVTIEGVGEDAELFQWGLTWKKCSSIEVRNLTFDDYTEDACSFEGSSGTTADTFNSQRIWLHNNVFNEGKNYWDVCLEQDKKEGDGATDFKQNGYVTISYNRYFENHKTGLIGGGDTSLTANVTFHHNFYDQCTSRLPLGRQANMHMYNNYYYNSGSYSMSLRAGAYALVENCYFEGGQTPIETKDGNNKRAVAKVYNCIFNGDYASNNALTDEYLASYNISVVTDRTAVVDNDNVFNKTFDTDSSAFYYDSENNCSKVTNMLTAAQTKVQVPKLAGVMKRSNQLSDEVEDEEQVKDETSKSPENSEPQSGTTLSAFSVTASDLASADFSGTSIAWDSNGIITLYNGMVNDTVWSYDSSGGGRLKPNSTAQYIIIDLSEYSGNYALVMEYAPAGDTARTITLAENVSGANYIYQLTTNNTTRVTTDAQSLVGGKVYKISFSGKGGCNFYSMTISPKS